MTLQVQREFKGVNKLEPFSIPDEFATDQHNISSNEYPVLSVRAGYSVLGEPVDRVRGLGSYMDAELHAVFDDGSWRRWNGSEWVTVATNLDVTKDWSFCNFKGGFSNINLLAANGSQAKKWNGTTLSNLSDAPIGLNYIEQYADRVWGIVGNTLHASGYRNAEDWTSTPPPDAIDDSVSFFAEIETPDGETINGLKAGLGRLVIFKPSAMFELRGYSPSDYRVDPISTNIGVINNRCIAVLQSGMYFLDDTGIYVYHGDGVAPQKGFSKPVQWFVDHMNPAGKQNCSVGTDGKLLYVSIPMESTDPDTILVFDPERYVWNVYSGFSAVHFANVGTNTFLGDSDGSVRLLGGQNDDGQPIPWLWVSKPFTAGSLAQFLRWTKLWLTLRLPPGSTLTVSISRSAEGDDWVPIATLEGNDLQRKSIPLMSNIQSEQLRLKLEGIGPCTVYEIAREEESLPMR